MFLNIHAILKVLLTTPVSAVTAERSFSGLRHLKTYICVVVCQKHASLVLLYSTFVMTQNELMPVVPEELLSCILLTQHSFIIVVNLVFFVEMCTTTALVLSLLLLLS